MGPPASSYGPVVVKPLADPGWSGDPVMPCCDSDRSTNRDPFATGLAALQAQDFAKAEEIFARFTVRQPRSAEARLYLAVTQMNLGKWRDAKKNLEFAAARKPFHPDPKSRLGVTDAKLGDTAGANAQRAKLAKMAELCKGACELLPYISDGIQMIDQALAEARP